jgi:IS30 family transposase
MNIEDFEKLMPPKAKRSRLQPYLREIFQLKDKGYANWQIAEWLAHNEIKVSQETVRKFIISRETTDSRIRATPPMPEKETRNETQSAPTQSSNKAITEIEENNISENRSDPARITAIMRSTPDLDALAKAGKLAIKEMKK